MGSAAARQGQRKGDFLAGKYLLEDCLGIGGMGEVYRATNVSLGRKVAIKLLSPEYVHIEEDVLRFLREARAAAAVRHSNVVDVLDVARDDDGTPFIVQELLSGEDLERYLKARGGRLSFDEALEIMIQVTDAVAAAHAQNVVHRDLKPANIFLARDRNKITPKVLDFGACLFPTIAERSAKEVRMLIGTPHYMAPEQIVSKADVGAPSDVWALGVIFYEMLVGETPFEAETANAVLNLVKTRDVPPLREQCKTAPVELEEVIAKCTKRDRLERFKDAGELHERLLGVKRRIRGESAASRKETIDNMPAPIIMPKSAPKLSSDGEAKPAARAKDTPSKDPPASSRRVPIAAPISNPIIVPKRNAALLTLSSPGSEPPPSGTAIDPSLDLDLPLPPYEPPVSASPGAARPLDRSEPSEVRVPPASAERPLTKNTPPLPRLEKKTPPVPTGRAFDASEVRAKSKEPSQPEFGEASLDLAAQPSSWPPPAQSAEPTERRAAPSSMPPVLDPRAAARPAPKIPVAAAPPVFATPPVFAPDEAEIDPAPVSTVPASTSSMDVNKPRPPAVTRPREDLTTSRAATMQRGWTLGESLKFVVLVAIPAVLGFVAVLVVPALGVPIGRALRGDSTLSSGVLAVAALIFTGVLLARAFLGERDRWVQVAAALASLFGIVMIIVTFSASEAAELGVPPTFSGLSTIVAPLAPLVLALGGLLKARGVWLDPYGKSERVRYAALASMMLFLALALSPMGAVRTPPHPPKALRGLLGS